MRPAIIGVGLGDSIPADATRRGRRSQTGCVKMVTKLTVLCRGYVPRKISIEHIRCILTAWHHPILGDVALDAYRHAHSRTDFRVLSPADHCSGQRNYFDLSRSVVEPELWSLNNDAAMLPTGMIVTPELAEWLGMRQRQRQLSARRCATRSSTQPVGA